MRDIEADVSEILETVKQTPSEELESDVLEFKGYRDEKAIHNAKDLAEEISALANHKGGLIVIGVKDTTDVAYGRWAEQLAGLPSVDLHTLRERVAGRIRPAVDLDVREVWFEDRRFIAMSVPRRTDTLVATSSGKTCIRDGRSSRPMAPDEIATAVKSLTAFDWSADPIPEADPLQLLDRADLADAIRDFGERRKMDTLPSEQAYLEAVGATRNGVLLKGGLVFLGTSAAIRSHLGDYEFRFSWKLANGELKINEVWEGNLWTAIRNARRCFDEANVYQGFEDEGRNFSVPLLDPVAFHEAYLNALVHRDYSHDGMVSVTYTGERLVVASPGTFYGGITVENIGRHEPRHRNKALARILMTHSLVDRAGMGVVRMSIRSLMYGRAFPEFSESVDSVEVSMEARFLRGPITILAHDNPEWGVSHLLLLNHVYESGYAPVGTLEGQLGRIEADPWGAIESAVRDLPQVELCGTREGVFVRVHALWRSWLKVDRVFRASPVSEKHVKLYRYLKRHGRVSNADLKELLGHKHSSQTSRFLRDASYVQRRGSGRSARWSLVS